MEIQHPSNPTPTYYKTKPSNVYAKRTRAEKCLARGFKWKFNIRAIQHQHTIKQNRAMCTQSVHERKVSSTRLQMEIQHPSIPTPTYYKTKPSNVYAKRTRAEKCLAQGFKWKFKIMGCQHQEDAMKLGKRSAKRTYLVREHWSDR